MRAPVASGGLSPWAGRLGATSTAVRRHNLAALLERLHSDGPTSRSELGAGTGLSRSSVADLVHELVTRGLAVEEGRTTTPGPGRPSSTVRVRPEGAVVLAVDLGVESVALACIGLGGSVLREERVTLPRAARTPERVVARVADVARGLLEQLPGGALAGVGVAVPGTTRRSDGFVHLAPNLGWSAVPLGSLVTEALAGGGGVDHTGVRVRVANEADLGALGEHRRGAGRGYDHVLFVSGGVGIGAGLIVDGRPMLGASGYAGEAGHMLVDPAGRPCSCGRVGCWETVAGEAALLGSGEVSGEGARWLGVGVGNLVNLLDPEVVVLGGCYAPHFDRLEPDLRAGLASRGFSVGSAATVVPSTLGRLAQLHGAAELCLETAVADPTARPRA